MCIRDRSIGRLLQLVEVRFVIRAGFADDQKLSVAPVTLSYQARGGFDKQVLAFESCDLSHDSDCQPLRNAEARARLLTAQIAAAAGVDPIGDRDDAIGETGE